VPREEGRTYRRSKGRVGALGFLRRLRSEVRKREEGKKKPAAGRERFATLFAGVYELEKPLLGRLRDIRDRLGDRNSCPYNFFLINLREHRELIKPCI